MRENHNPVSEKSSFADEFQNVPLNDMRLINRLIFIATVLEQNPEKSIPEAFQDWAGTKAAYRFLDNDKVTPEAIQASHRQQTLERMKKHLIVLILQDTTVFDYTSHPNTEGLGPYSTSLNTLGLLMHSVLVVTTTGVPLGVLYQDIWARDPLEFGKKHARHELPIEEKESFKWLKAMDASLKVLPEGLMAVTVCDREADIYELFKKAYQEEHPLLVRAVQNRRIAQEHKLLWKQIENTPVAGFCTVEIPRNPERKLPPRKVQLSVQFCQVTICPPLTKTDNLSANVELYAVLAKEINPPLTDEPIKWFLLTTLPVTNLEEAVEKIGWYRQRWMIERFHFVLKSGCKVEELQLENDVRLKNAIAIYLVVAWRLTWILYQSRETPEAPCSIILETHEWQSLYCIVNKTKVPPKNSPSLQEAVMLIARLGGFLGRKSDGQPGVKVLWRGLQKLNDTIMFAQHLQSLPHFTKDVGNE
jgi:hypothetical protein